MSTEEPVQWVFEQRLDSKSYNCPCCKFKTLFMRGGNEICPVCFWEDDGQDEPDADRVLGGPNRNLSLRQARDNFKRLGATEERFLVHVRAPLPDEM